MKHFSKLLLVFLVCLLPFASVSAETASFISMLVEQVSQNDFPQVEVRLSAWDSAGLPLEGLTTANFILQEDGGQAFQPQKVSEDPNAPLQVVLLLDISGSMQGQPLEDAKNAAARFLDHLQAGDQAALIAFSDDLDPQMDVQDPDKELYFNEDLTPLYNLIEGLQAGGETHLYAAAAKAVRFFEDQPNGHRAVILLSDGRNEPAEVGDPAEALSLADELSVPFFVIGLGDKIDLSYLQNLAHESGGLFRAVPSSAELADLFRETASLLKTQYVLSYESVLLPDGETHSLQVSLQLGDQITSQELDLGPLPYLPTAEPTQTALPLEPTLTFTPEVLPVLSATPTPVMVSVDPDETALLRSRIIVLSLILVGLLTLILIWVLLRRRKKRPKPEACGQCGFDLTGVSGPCPQCGSSRRLPKRK